MNKEIVSERIKPIFYDVFDDDTLIIENSTSSADIEDWDSLAQISLIVAMEHDFKVKFNLEEVNELKNVGEMIDLILKKVSEK